MRIFHDILKEPLGMNRPAVTLGTFDGLHRGHIAILDRLREVARESGAPRVAVTFDPHPQRVLATDSRAPGLLSTLDERLARFEYMGLDCVVVIPFDRDFSRWSAERFVDEVLVKHMSAGRVVVGYDHAFGHDRRGKADMLTSYLAPQGIVVDVVPPVKSGDGPVKSSRIRRLLAAGEIDMANSLLGYEYSFTGTVVRGDGRGAEIGFPTANLDVPEVKQLPSHAIYGATVHLGNKAHHGLVHLGPRPTLGETQVRVEVHLLDFSARDLYGEQMTVTPEVELRKVEAFSSLNALVTQLKKDRTQYNEYRNRKENARAS
jgi:riboflavin kinase/FMN adenylyltransferase